NISAEPFERAAQIAELFGFAPRQRAVTLQRRDAEFFDSGAIFAGERGEGIWTELRRTEIEEMTRIVFPAGRPPEIGIDDSDDELGAEMSKERLQLRWEHVNRALHDEAMRGGAPREGRRWEERRGDR